MNEDHHVTIALGAAARRSIGEEQIMWSHFCTIVLVAMSVGAVGPIPPQTVSEQEPAAKIDLSQFVRMSQSERRADWWPAVQALGGIAGADDGWRDDVWRQAKVNTLGMKFVLIEPGTFVMGPDTHRIFDIQWPHQVEISRAYWMSVTEVTNAQFQSLFPRYKVDARYSPDADSPAVNITWKMAAEFCARLSELEEAVYRLPTEAEWEYACRAGTQTRYCYGRSVKRLSKYAWYDYVNGRASPVAMLLPNDWGLYDMHGNAFEWVSDWFSHDYYGECAKNGLVLDPPGPPAGSTHVLRGGGWQVRNPAACTSTARFPLPIFDHRPFDPDHVGMRQTIGFRIVREPGERDGLDEADAGQD